MAGKRKKKGKEVPLTVNMAFEDLINLSVNHNPKKLKRKSKKNPPDKV